jgi:hypothetical protein
MIPTHPVAVNRRGGAVLAGRCAVGHADPADRRSSKREPERARTTHASTVPPVGVKRRSPPLRGFATKRIQETQTRSDQHRYTPAVHSRPVFTDPSGRRRRAMRRIGLVSAAALAICLGAVVVAMAGGPAAPFTNWAAPRAPAAATHDGAPVRVPARGTAGTSPSSPRPGLPPVPSASAGSAPPASGSVTAQPTASGTAAASATSPPVPTNPAGRTPPGHTKSPRPGNPHGL